MRRQIFLYILASIMGTFSVPSPRLLAPFQCRSPDLPSFCAIASFDQVAWESTFASTPDEVCIMLGENWPREIFGTYYRNVCGRYLVGDQPVLHPNDADGMIAAVTFRDGRAIFRNRLVQTRGLRKEKRVGRVLFRSQYAGLKPGGPAPNAFDFNIKNTASTDVVSWGGQLLALWDGGLPHRIAADSLRTLGESRLRGMIRPGQMLAGRMRYDAAQDSLVFFTTQHTRGATKITVREVNRTFVLTSMRTFEVRGYAVLSDFAVTASHYVFSQASCYHHHVSSSCIIIMYHHHHHHGHHHVHTLYNQQTNN
jgi:carotenoid cleavage dioxygenase-like enzyme